MSVYSLSDCTANGGRVAGRRDEKAEETKAHIARVAMELFAEHGFAATSTRKIAKAAGVSEGLVFHHFRNKIGLLTGAASSSPGLAAYIAEGLAADPNVPVEVQLTRIARGFTSFLRADRIETKVFRVLMAESTTNPDLYALQQERTHSVVAGLGAYLQSRVEVGELRSDLVVESAAQLLLGSFLWFFFTHMHLSPEEWTEAAGAHADAVVSQWLRGALPPESGRAS